MDKRLYHKRGYRDLALAALSGVMLALAFPKPGLFPLAWVGLVPLVVALRRARPWAGFGLGLTTGFVFFAGLMFWVSMFGFLPYVLLALVQGLQVAVFGLGAACIYRRRAIPMIAVPALWTAIEWFRSLGVFALTWGGLSYSQAPWPSAIQVSAIFGPWGVTFLIVLVNEGIARLIVDRDRAARVSASVAVGLAVLSTLAGWAYIRAGDRPERAIRVAMVQGGVPFTWRDESTSMRIMETYWPMTTSLKGAADLIVWPESAAPGDVLGDPALRESVSQLARTTGAHMLIGGYHAEGDPAANAGKMYNGAYLFDPDGLVVGSYYKVHLVPFGEFVPGRNWLPLLNRYHIMEFDRTSGPGYNTMRARFGDVGTMICFESTFPQVGCEFARRGAGLLAVITNDSWFGQSAAGAQHHQFAVLRAVENHRYVLRNASTGITSLISPYGEVEKSVGLDESAVVSGRVAIVKGLTPYSRFGDWFAWACALVTVSAFAKAALRPTGHSR